ncbi:hypothetical protein Taro_040539 [Colocasia esculenta]|uniref:Uncharacterized protein n=1 Tax=Colocasia esculenta TaxID=4460 RepID=A0A843WJB6_COLES|nr:hypothetical protein [Colocasia esculenta]
MWPAVGAVQQRYLVDVEFMGKFYIARPTTKYEQVVAELPKVFMGRSEDLRLLRVLALTV